MEKRPRAKPKKVHASTWICEQMHIELKEAALKNGMNPCEFMREIIRARLEQEAKQ